MHGLHHLTPFSHIPICDDTYNPTTRHNTPCPELRTKIIALRVYFAILLNLLFIVSTTSYFVYRMLSVKWAPPPTDLASATNCTISKRWQMYSLKKRGLFGNVLGAIGYLVFSAAVFSYQAFVNTFSCNVYVFASMLGFYIWIYAIIWRTHRLHLLLRMNELQGRYHAKNTATSTMNRPNLTQTATRTTDAKEEDEGYIWFMRHKEKLSKSTAYHTFIFCAFIFVIFIIITLSETLGIWQGGYSRCELYIGNYMVLGMVIVLFVVIMPLIVWYLRNDNDAHGMRKELWITMLVGTPCFVMCIVWQALFLYPSDMHPAVVRGKFGPSNWIVFITTTNHIVTIILPVFKTLSVDGSKKKRRRSAAGLTGSRRSFYVKDSRVSDIMYFKGHHHRNVSTTTIQNSLTLNDFRWELSTESLFQALCDPNTLKILKDWAVKDFSVENVLFYDHYIYLVQQLDRAIASARQQQLAEDSKSLLGVPASTKSGQQQHSSKTTTLEVIQTTYRESIISQATTLSKPMDEVLHIPFTSDLISDFVEFYTTFIADQAPLQVNISHKARKDIDSILKPFATNAAAVSPTTDSKGIFDEIPLKNPEESHQNLRGTTYKLLSTSINAYRSHSEIIMENDTPAFPNSNSTSISKKKYSHSNS